jgi:Zn-dependent protease with chaperone function
MGVRVDYDQKAKFISDSRGIGRWKKVVVGPLFMQFPPREQQAILLHEVAHCKLFHVEHRLKNLWLLFWRPSSLRQLCIDQEHEADAFVRSCGFGTDLALAFSKLRLTEHLLHPSTSERIARLTGQS